MKSLFYVQIVLITVALPVLTSAESGLVKVVPHVKACVFRVERMDSTFLGTAFVINTKGNFMTCEHVVRGLDSVYLVNYTTVRQPDSTLRKREVRFIAQIDTTVNALDLAVLTVILESQEINKAPFLGLRHSDQIQEGEDMALCAFITDDYSLPKPFLSRGIVSTHRRNLFSPILDNTISVIQLDLSISKGNSGGPVFDPSTGHVVAMLREGIFESNVSRFTGYAGALTIDQLLPTLDSLKIAYDVR